MDSKTLIYIIGAGRSGTTILDIILGNAQNAISLGEVNRFFKRGGQPPKRNETDPASVFWKNIGKDFEKYYGEAPVFARLDDVVKANEYHMALVKTLTGKRDKAYTDIIGCLYKAIFKNCKETILIESSKYPLRAYNLMKVLDPETVSIKFIYLKKDPVKVVRSFQKRDLEQPSKGLIAANFYYFLVNSLCILTVWLLKRKRFDVVSIKYGHLLADPLATLTKIETALAVNLLAAKEKIVGEKHLDTGFLFDGNRIRLSKTLKLRKENSSNSTNFGSLFTRVFNYVIYR